MILNTGNRTDIPAYFSEWFYRRIREGTVCVRNPYFPEQVTVYRLDPAVVDCIVFCTKNPRPMLAQIAGIDAFGQYWFVTITPYGEEIEPHVPDPAQVIADVRALARLMPKREVCWRYDPVFIMGRYSLEFHKTAFARMAEQLSGSVNVCVVSFIDLYEKTLRNFKGVKSVTAKERRELLTSFVNTGRRFGIRIKTCAEGEAPAGFGTDTGGCLTKETLEHALGESLTIPARVRARAECACLLGNDIGVYNTCGHGCLYCYANYDSRTVAENRAQHDPASPFLIGRARPEDIVHAAKQESFRNGQLRLPFF